MKLFTFVEGPIENNTYLVADSAGGEAMVVDAPFGSAEVIARAARDHKLTVRSIVTTHGHWDHIADLAALKRLTGAALLCHPADEILLMDPDRMRAFGMPGTLEPVGADRNLNHGDTVTVGALAFRVLHCPGHAPGHIVLHEPREKICFCGDVIFAGSVGRTDLPGCSWDALARSIRENILSLPDDTRLLPGHGPETTVGYERENNPFLQ
ncbi:MAG: MBL fold metallo-hydrolase [Verrucomicrobiae bacterium]|nr:MBL fold metallo-hydrolase [Verrucomicrobiae bacterium]